MQRQSSAALILLIFLLGVISTPIILHHSTHNEPSHYSHPATGLIRAINSSLSRVVDYDYYTIATVKTITNHTISIIKERGEVNYLTGIIRALRIITLGNTSKYQALLVNMNGSITIKTFNATGSLINQTTKKADPHIMVQYDPFYYLAYVLGHSRVRSYTNVEGQILITLTPPTNNTQITPGVKLDEAVLHVDPTTYLPTQVDYILISQTGTVSRITTYFTNYQIVS